MATLLSRTFLPSNNNNNNSNINIINKNINTNTNNNNEEDISDLTVDELHRRITLAKANLSALETYYESVKGPMRKDQRFLSLQSAKDNVIDLENQLSARMGELRVGSSDADGSAGSNHIDVTDERTTTITGHPELFSRAVVLCSGAAQTGRRLRGSFFTPHAPLLHDTSANYSDAKTPKKCSLLNALSSYRSGGGSNISSKHKKIHSFSSSSSSSSNIVENVIEMIHSCCMISNSHQPQFVSEHNSNTNDDYDNDYDDKDNTSFNAAASSFSSSSKKLYNNKNNNKNKKNNLPLLVSGIPGKSNVELAEVHPDYAFPEEHKIARSRKIETGPPLGGAAIYESASNTSTTTTSNKAATAAAAASSPASESNLSSSSPNNFTNSPTTTTTKETTTNNSSSFTFSSSMDVPQVAFLRWYILSFNDVSIFSEVSLHPDTPIALVVALVEHAPRHFFTALPVDLGTSLFVRLILSGQRHCVSMMLSQLAAEQAFAMLTNPLLEVDGCWQELLIRFGGESAVKAIANEENPVWRLCSSTTTIRRRRKKNKRKNIHNININNKMNQSTNEKQEKENKKEEEKYEAFQEEQQQEKDEKENVETSDDGETSQSDGSSGDDNSDDDGTFTEAVGEEILKRNTTTTTNSNNNVGVSFVENNNNDKTSSTMKYQGMNASSTSTTTRRREQHDEKEQEEEEKEENGDDFPSSPSTPLLWLSICLGWVEIADVLLGSPSIIRTFVSEYELLFSASDIQTSEQQQQQNKENSSGSSGHDNSFFSPSRNYLHQMKTKNQRKRWIRLPLAAFSILTAMRQSLLSISEEEQQQQQQQNNNNSSGEKNTENNNNNSNSTNSNFDFIESIAESASHVPLAIIADPSGALENMFGVSVLPSHTNSKVFRSGRLCCAPFPFSLTHARAMFLGARAADQADYPSPGISNPFVGTATSASSVPQSGTILSSHHHHASSSSSSSSRSSSLEKKKSFSSSKEKDSSSSSGSGENKNNSAAAAASIMVAPSLAPLPPTVASRSAVWPPTSAEAVYRAYHEGSSGSLRFFGGPYGIGSVAALQGVSISQALSNSSSSGSRSRSNSPYRKRSSSSSSRRFGSSASDVDGDEEDAEELKKQQDGANTLQHLVKFAAGANDLADFRTIPALMMDEKNKNLLVISNTSENENEKDNEISTATEGNKSTNSPNKNRNSSRGGGGGGSPSSMSSRRSSSSSSSTISPTNSNKNKRALSPSQKRKEENIKKQKAIAASHAMLLSTRGPPVGITVRADTPFFEGQKYFSCEVPVFLLLHQPFITVPDAGASFDNLRNVVRPIADGCCRFGFCRGDFVAAGTRPSVLGEDKEGRSCGFMLVLDLPRTLAAAPKISTTTESLNPSSTNTSAAAAGDSRIRTTSFVKNQEETSSSTSFVPTKPSFSTKSSFSTSAKSKQQTSSSQSQSQQLSRFKSLHDYFKFRQVERLFFYVLYESNSTLIPIPESPGNNNNSFPRIVEFPFKSTSVASIACGIDLNSGVASLAVDLCLTALVTDPSCCCLTSGSINSNTNSNISNKRNFASGGMLNQEQENNNNNNSEMLFSGDATHGFYAAATLSVAHEPSDWSQMSLTAQLEILDRLTVRFSFSAHPPCEFYSSNASALSDMFVDPVVLIPQHQQQQEEQNYSSFENKNQRKTNSSSATRRKQQQQQQVTVTVREEDLEASMVASAPPAPQTVYHNISISDKVDYLSQLVGSYCANVSTEELSLHSMQSAKKLVEKLPIAADAASKNHLLDETARSRRTMLLETISNVNQQKAKAVVGLFSSSGSSSTSSSLPSFAAAFHHNAPSSSSSSSSSLRNTNFSSTDTKTQQQQQQQQQNQNPLALFFGHPADVVAFANILVDIRLALNQKHPVRSHLLPSVVDVEMILHSLTSGEEPVLARTSDLVLKKEFQKASSFSSLASASGIEKTAALFSSNNNTDFHDLDANASFLFTSTSNQQHKTTTSKGEGGETSKFFGGDDDDDGNDQNENENQNSNNNKTKQSLPNEVKEGEAATIAIRRRHFNALRSEKARLSSLSQIRDFVEDVLFHEDASHLAATVAATGEISLNQVRPFTSSTTATNSRVGTATSSTTQFRTTTTTNSANIVGISHEEDEFGLMSANNHDDDDNDVVPPVTVIVEEEENENVFNSIEENLQQQQQQQQNSSDPNNNNNESTKKLKKLPTEIASFNFDEACENFQMASFEEMLPFALSHHPTASISATPLCACIRLGWFPLAKQLARCLVVDVNASDSLGFTPTMLCVVTSQPELLRYLVFERNAMLTPENQEGYTVMHLAILMDRVECLKVLLDHPSTFSCPTPPPLQIPTTSTAISSQEKINKNTISSSSSSSSTTKTTNLKSFERTISEEERKKQLDQEQRERDLLATKMKLEWVLNIKTPNGSTVAMLAVKMHRIDLLKSLSRRGADLTSPDYFGDTPLLHALVVKSYDLVDILLDSKQYTQSAIQHRQKHAPRGTAILFAALDGRTDICRRLVGDDDENDGKADADGGCCGGAARDGGLEITFNPSSLSVLHCAVLSGRWECVEFFAYLPRKDPTIKLNLSAVEERSNLTPLHQVVQRGDVELCGTLTRLLLTADTRALNKQDATGNTPLMTAIIHNQPECANLMIHLARRKLHTECFDKYGCTALSIAAELGQVDVAIALIEDAKAEMNFVNINGYTPLSSAIVNGHIHTAEAIIHAAQERIDLSIYRSAVPAAFELAYERGYFRLCRLIIAAGVSVSREKREKVLAVEFSPTSSNSSNSEKEKEEEKFPLRSKRCIQLHQVGDSICKCATIARPPSIFSGVHIIDKTYKKNFNQEQEEDDDDDDDKNKKMKKNILETSRTISPQEFGRFVAKTSPPNKNYDYAKEGRSRSRPTSSSRTSSTVSSKNQSSGRTTPRTNFIPPTFERPWDEKNISSSTNNNNNRPSTSTSTKNIRNLSPGRAGPALSSSSSSGRPNTVGAASTGYISPYKNNHHQNNANIIRNRFISPGSQQRHENNNPNPVTAFSSTTTKLITSVTNLRLEYLPRSMIGVLSHVICLKNKIHTVGGFDFHQQKQQKQQQQDYVSKDKNDNDNQEDFAPGSAVRHSTAREVASLILSSMLHRLPECKTPLHALALLRSAYRELEKVVGATSSSSSSQSSNNNQTSSSSSSHRLSSATSTTTTTKSIMMNTYTRNNSSNNTPRKVNTSSSSVCKSGDEPFSPTSPKQQQQKDSSSSSETKTKMVFSDLLRPLFSEIRSVCENSPVSLFGLITLVSKLLFDKFHAEISLEKSEKSNIIQNQQQETEKSSSKKNTKNNNNNMSVSSIGTKKSSLAKGVVSFIGNENLLSSSSSQEEKEKSSQITNNINKRRFTPGAELFNSSILTASANITGNSTDNDITSAENNNNSSGKNNNNNNNNKNQQEQQIRIIRFVIDSSGSDFQLPTPLALTFDFLRRVTPETTPDDAYYNFFEKDLKQLLIAKKISLACFSSSLHSLRKNNRFFSFFNNETQQLKHHHHLTQILSRRHGVSPLQVAVLRKDFRAAAALLRLGSNPFQSSLSILDCRWSRSIRDRVVVVDNPGEKDPRCLDEESEEFVEVVRKICENRKELMKKLTPTLRDAMLAARNEVANAMLMGNNVTQDQDSNNKQEDNQQDTSTVVAASSSLLMAELAVTSNATAAAATQSNTNQKQFSNNNNNNNNTNESESASFLEQNYIFDSPIVCALKQGDHEMVRLLLCYSFDSTVSFENNDNEKEETEKCTPQVEEEEEVEVKYQPQEPKHPATLLPCWDNISIVTDSLSMISEIDDENFEFFIKKKQQQQEKEKNKKTSSSSKQQKQQRSNSTFSTRRKSLISQSSLLLENSNNNNTGDSFDDDEKDNITTSTSSGQNKQTGKRKRRRSFVDSYTALHLLIANPMFSDKFIAEMVEENGLDFEASFVPMEIIEGKYFYLSSSSNKNDNNKVTPRYIRRWKTRCSAIALAIRCSRTSLVEFACEKGFVRPKHLCLDTLCLIALRHCPSLLACLFAFLGSQEQEQFQQKINQNQSQNINNNNIPRFDMSVPLSGSTNLQSQQSFSVFSPAIAAATASTTTGSYSSEHNLTSQQQPTSFSSFTAPNTSSSAVAAVVRKILSLPRDQVTPVLELIAAALYQATPFPLDEKFLDSSDSVNTAAANLSNTAVTTAAYYKEQRNHFFSRPSSAQTNASSTTLSGGGGGFNTSDNSNSTSNSNSPNTTSLLVSSDGTRRPDSPSVTGTTTSFLHHRRNAVVLAMFGSGNSILGLAVRRQCLGFIEKVLAIVGAQYFFEHHPRALLQLESYDDNDADNNEKKVTGKNKNDDESEEEYDSSSDNEDVDEKKYQMSTTTTTTKRNSSLSLSSPSPSQETRRRTSVVAFGSVSSPSTTTTTTTRSTTSLKQNDSSRKQSPSSSSSSSQNRRRNNTNKKEDNNNNNIVPVNAIQAIQRDLVFHSGNIDFLLLVLRSLATWRDRRLFAESVAPRCHPSVVVPLLFTACPNISSLTVNEDWHIDQWPDVGNDFAPKDCFQTIATEQQQLQQQQQQKEKKSQKQKSEVSSPSTEQQQQSTSDLFSQETSRSHIPRPPSSSSRPSSQQKHTRSQHQYHSSSSSSAVPTTTSTSSEQTASLNIGGVTDAWIQEGAALVSLWRSMLWCCTFGSTANASTNSTLHTQMKVLLRRAVSLSPNHAAACPPDIALLLLSSAPYLSVTSSSSPISADFEATFLKQLQQLRATAKSSSSSSIKHRTSSSGSNLSDTEKGLADRGIIRAWQSQDSLLSSSSSAASPSSSTTTATTTSSSSSSSKQGVIVDANGMNERRVSAAEAMQAAFAGILGKSSATTSSTSSSTQNLVKATAAAAGSSSNSSLWKGVSSVVRASGMTSSSQQQQQQEAISSSSTGYSSSTYNVLLAGVKNKSSNKNISNNNNIVSPLTSTEIQAVRLFNPLEGRIHADAAQNAWTFAHTRVLMSSRGILSTARRFSFPFASHTWAAAEFHRTGGESESDRRKRRRIAARVANAFLSGVAVTSQASLADFALNNNNNNMNDESSTSEQQQQQRQQHSSTTSRSSSATNDPVAVAQSNATHMASEVAAQQFLHPVVTKLYGVQERSLDALLSKVLFPYIAAAASIKIPELQKKSDELRSLSGGHSSSSSWRQKEQEQNAQAASGGINSERAYRWVASVCRLASRNGNVEVLELIRRILWVAYNSQKLDRQSTRQSMRATGGMLRPEQEQAINGFAAQKRMEQINIIRKCHSEHLFPSFVASKESVMVASSTSTSSASTSQQQQQQQKSRNTVASNELLEAATSILRLSENINDNDNNTNTNTNNNAEDDKKHQTNAAFATSTAFLQCIEGDKQLSQLAAAADLELDLMFRPEPIADFPPIFYMLVSQEHLLFTAAKFRRFEVLQYLLINPYLAQSRDANGRVLVDYVIDNVAPLCDEDMRAVTACVGVLLHARAPLSLRFIKFVQKVMKQPTPLKAAVRVHINMTSEFHNDTLLHLACLHDQVEVARLILQETSSNSNKFELIMHKNRYNQGAWEYCRSYAITRHVLSAASEAAHKKEAETVLQAAREQQRQQYFMEQQSQQQSRRNNLNSNSNIHTDLNSSSRNSSRRDSRSISPVTTTTNVLSNTQQQHNVMSATTAINELVSNNNPKQKNVTPTKRHRSSPSPSSSSSAMMMNIDDINNNLPALRCVVSALFPSATSVTECENSHSNKKNDNNNNQQLTNTNTTTTSSRRATVIHVSPTLGGDSNIARFHAGLTSMGFVQLLWSDGAAASLSKLSTDVLVQDDTVASLIQQSLNNRHHSHSHSHHSSQKRKSLASSQSSTAMLMASQTFSGGGLQQTHNSNSNNRGMSLASSTTTYGSFAGDATLMSATQTSGNFDLNSTARRTSSIFGTSRRESSREKKRLERKPSSDIAAAIIQMSDAKITKFQSNSSSSSPTTTTTKSNIYSNHHHRRSTSPNTNDNSDNDNDTGSAVNTSRPSSPTSSTQQQLTRENSRIFNTPSSPTQILSSEALYNDRHVATWMIQALWERGFSIEGIDTRGRWTCVPRHTCVLKAGLNSRSGIRLALAAFAPWNIRQITAFAKKAKSKAENRERKEQQQQQQEAAASRNDNNNGDNGDNNNNNNEDEKEKDNSNETAASQQHHYTSRRHQHYTSHVVSTQASNLERIHCPWAGDSALADRTIETIAPFFAIVHSAEFSSTNNENSKTSHHQHGKKNTTTTTSDSNATTLSSTKRNEKLYDDATSGSSPASTSSLLISVCPEMNSFADSTTTNTNTKATMSEPTSFSSATTTGGVGGKPTQFQKNTTVTQMRETIFSMITRVIDSNASSLRFASMCDLLTLGDSEESRIVQASVSQWITALKMQQDPELQSHFMSNVNENIIPTTTDDNNKRKQESSSFGSFRAAFMSAQSSRSSSMRFGQQNNNNEEEKDDNNNNNNIVVVPWYHMGKESDILDPSIVQRLIDSAELDVPI